MSDIVRPKGIHFLRTLLHSQEFPGISKDDVFIDVCTIETETHSLSRAVNLGSIRLVRTLIEGGADVNSRNLDDQTALLVFCAKEHPVQEGRSPTEMLDFLLSKGADVNLQDRYGKTALMYACGVQQNPQIVERLLERGADVFLEDHIGFSALTYAYNCQNQGLIQLLSSHCQRVGRQMVLLETKLDANFMSYLKIQKLVGATRSSVAIDKQLPTASPAAGGQMRQVRRLSAVADRVSKFLVFNPRKRSSVANAFDINVIKPRMRSKSSENVLKVDTRRLSTLSTSKVDTPDTRIPSIIVDSLGGESPSHSPVSTHRSTKQDKQTQCDESEFQNCSSATQHNEKRTEER